MKHLGTAVLLLLTAAILQPVVAQPGLREAIESHRARVAEQPGDPKLLTDLGNLLVLAGEMNEAEEVYRRALDLDETQVTARYNLALLLHQTGRPRLARREQTKVLDLRPDHAWAHYQLGTLAAEAGERSRAIKHYARAFSLDRRLTQAEFNPHIIDNELAIPAVMKAHGSSASAALAPRQYEEPGRITKLLVPALAEVEADRPVEDRPEAPGAPPTAAGTPGQPREAPAEGSSLPAATESGDRETASAQETPEESADERRALRRRIRGQPAPVTVAPPSQPVPPAAGATAPGSPAAPAAPGGSRVVPPPARPEEPDDEVPEFRPDLPSTAKLDLRLVPSTAGPAASRG